MGRLTDKRIWITGASGGLGERLAYSCVAEGAHVKREIVKHPGAVAVLAVTEEGKIILVNQFRKPLERTIVEIPAGKLEKGEEPEHTALRELEEETGYTAETLTKITAFYTSPGFADEIVHLFLAEGFRR